MTFDDAATILDDAALIPSDLALVYDLATGPAGVPAWQSGADLAELFRNALTEAGLSAAVERGVEGGRAHMLSRWLLRDIELAEALLFMVQHLGYQYLLEKSEGLDRPSGFRPDLLG